jgi:hypothetical protein
MLDLAAYILTGVFFIWFIECMWQLGKTVHESFAYNNFLWWTFLIVEFSVFSYFMGFIKTSLILVLALSSAILFKRWGNAKESN